MKTLGNALIVAFLALILTNCGLWRKSPKYDRYSYDSTEDHVPEHVGPVWASGQKDIYTYRAYARSIDFRAPEVFITSQIGVFDLNNDNHYDTVCVRYGDTWHIGFTKDLRKKYQMMKPDLPDKVVCEYIGLANHITRTESKKPKPASKMNKEEVSLTTSPFVGLTKEEKSLVKQVEKIHQKIAPPEEPAESFKESWLTNS